MSTRKELRQKLRNAKRDLRVTKQLRLEWIADGLFDRAEYLASVVASIRLDIARIRDELRTKPILRLPIPDFRPAA
ncbi:hypothetical protein [Pseudolysinimonas sp.]|uniref:hypothetical protein n=1 Tax=Pseudolysinimonas sp. TaxID=2680009 RepID=UPI003F8225FB